MAIYHFSAQMITRSKGQSSVAAAAYRSGERLEDERTGETKFYKREVQPETMILAPSNSPSWINDRERLWNEVEQSEKRKNSQLAREINIALPKEISNDQQKELIQNYVQTEFVNKGMVADISIHRDDKENPHAHVMLTTREISEEGFTVKNRDWNDKELLKQWREQWAEHTNKELEKIGVEKISHLSHEARGLETLPTIHLGHVASAMEKDGKESDRGKINNEIKECNRAIIIDLQKYREEKEAILQAQKQKTKEKSFLMTDEKIAIKEAEKRLGEKVTLSSIKAQRIELNDWSKQVEQNSTNLLQKGKLLDQAKQELSWIKSIETNIQVQQEKINNARFYEKKIKDNAKTEITHLESDLQFRNEQLKPTLEKLGVNKESLVFELKKFDRDRTELNSAFREERKEINKQTAILDRAENAIKQGEIREITSHYPELKNTGQFMKYEDVLKLKEINQKVGKVVPLDQIKTTINDRNNAIEKVENAHRKLEILKQNVATAQVYFNELNAVESKIEKTENNPFLKGKLMFSEKARSDYEQDKSKRDQYKSALKNLGIEDKEKLHQYKELIQKAEKYKPLAEKQANDLKEGNGKDQNGKEQNGIGLGLLESAIQGIEQASEREQRETRRKAERQRYRGQKQQDGIER